MKRRAVRIAAAIAALACAAAAQEHGDHAPQAIPGESMPYPRLADDGRLHIVYVDDRDGAKRVRYRQMFGEAAVESDISSPEERLSHWPESPPKVEVTSDGAIHVLYTVQLAKPGAVDLKYVASRDGGKTWSGAESVGQTGLEVYRSCAAISEDAQSRLVVSWLEGNFGSPAVGVRTATRADGAFDIQFLDQRACECCATELMRAGDGSMWLGYRDVDELNVRDMYVSRMTPEAERFGPPNRISRDKWVINGCPDTGPRFALAPEGAVWATWFSGSPRGIYAARATESAPQFSARELVQALDPDMTGIVHPDVEILPDGRVLVAYQCTRNGYRHIEGRARAADGWSEPIRLGNSGEYPRIAANGRQAYLIYTAIRDGKKSVAIRDLAELIPPVN